MSVLKYLRNNNKKRNERDFKKLRNIIYRNITFISSLCAELIFSSFFK